MPVKIKTKVTHSMFYKERNNLESNVVATNGLRAYEDTEMGGDPLYIKIDAESGCLDKWIPN